MTIAGIIKHVLDGLWLVGGIGAAADLSMEDFGPGAEIPCPLGDQSPPCSSQKARASGALADFFGHAAARLKRPRRDR